jgi:hypothetical protein
MYCSGHAYNTRGTLIKSNPINKPGATKGKKGGAGDAAGAAPEAGSNSTTTSAAALESATSAAAPQASKSETAAGTASPEAPISTSTLGAAIPVPKLTASSAAPVAASPSKVARAVLTGLDRDLEQYKRILAQPDHFNAADDLKLHKEVEKQVAGRTLRTTSRTRKTSAYWQRYNAGAIVPAGPLPPGPFQQMNLDAKAHRPNYRNDPTRRKKNALERWTWTWN